MTYISIYQKNWAFTTDNSPITKIRTGSFGPCYVVTFATKGYAAMAHIDDNVKVSSMQAIFNKFKEHAIALSEVKVMVLGGWEQNSESFKWGEKIVTKLEKAGFCHVNKKMMYSKRTMTLVDQMIGISEQNVKDFYFFGAFIDATTGKTYLVNQRAMELEEQQLVQTKQFAMLYGEALNVEIPLTQIT